MSHEDPNKGYRVWDISPGSSHRSAVLEKALRKEHDMFDLIDTRKEKRLCRRMGLNATYESYRGQNQADPMGDFMGRNV